MEFGIQQTLIIVAQLIIIKKFNDQRELGDRNIGKTLNNIGELYFKMGDYSNSLTYYDQSLDLKKLNDIAESNSSIIIK